MKAKRAAAKELAVDLPRLQNDLESLGRIGYSGADGGIHRVSFSDADMDGRRWLMTRFEEAGLKASMDAVGNVFGRWEIGSGPTVLVGSHLDSVPRGGRFDGSLGVIAGLECVRSLKDRGVQLASPIEVVATSEEEGRFGGMLGAQALTGRLTREQLENARDESGLALTDAMRAQGLDPEAALAASRKPSSIKAFLELHVEQGPILESRGKTIGIVEGISGVFNWTVRLSGTANHAGTTPMDLRRDAFMGLAQFAARIPDIIATVGSDQSRITIGRVELQPNFPHTVPGAAEFSLVGRDLDEQVMTTLAEACRDAMRKAAEAQNLDCSIEQTAWLAPRPCSPAIIAAFREQATKLGLDTLMMPSGAGHDTQLLSEVTEAGMIFVPSIGGISHSPDERTDWADIEVGSNLLLHTLLSVANECTQADCT